MNVRLANIHFNGVTMNLFHTTIWNNVDCRKKRIPKKKTTTTTIKLNHVYIRSFHVCVCATIINCGFESKWSEEHILVANAYEQITLVEFSTYET